MYLFKDNDRNTKKECEISSKLAIKTPQRRHRGNDNFKHISRLFLVFLLLALNE